ncbi:hypothetical protein GDO78_023053 [Eleutherodactylus coqui]|uniref:Uncharacterized protein n=1 Tax=Eleutherodactylus coqui TaxID=57060 RepID=A0A8J6EBM4_ELECQ|nr:hypothetical protein GDO78_023053 [Eleutherodactylus coqui]
MGQRAGSASGCRKSPVCTSKRMENPFNNNAKEEAERLVAKENKNNPKLFFNYINSKRMCTESAGPLTNNADDGWGEKPIKRFLFKCI